MRFPLFRSSLLVSMLIASAASAVTMAWTPVGNPGNACDPQFDGCFGFVTGYAYQIGTFEVTNAQYAEFLNAKASVSDPLGLYNPSMGDPEVFNFGGITRTGSGPFTYTAIAGRENMPVNHISFYDALRFANWMNNGQGSGDTETGAYTLLGGTPEPSNGTTVTRNASATIFLPSEDEWYKAAYYDGKRRPRIYFDYPAGTDTPTVCAAPGATANTANCSPTTVPAGVDLTDVGSYTASASPYGTFDQGGNAYEWNETVSGPGRGLRGGSNNHDQSRLAASAGYYWDPATEEWGFRVAPEPGKDLLLAVGVLGLLGLAGWRRARA